MNEKFVKIFDFAHTGFQLQEFFFWGMTFITLGLVLLLIRKVAKQKYSQPFFLSKTYKIFLILYLSFSIVWTGLSLYVTAKEYFVLKLNDCKIVEGKVENFSQTPMKGKEFESFTLEGIRFSYSEEYPANGFNLESSPKGTINKDSVVKICYVTDKHQSIIKELFLREN